MDQEYWYKKINGFLHEPPDKPVKLSGHEQRAKEILNKLSIPLEKEAHIKKADTWASASQRFNLPSSKFSIDFKSEQKPLFIHTLTGEREMGEGILEFKELGRVTSNGVDSFLQELHQIEKSIAENFREDTSEPKEVYFRLWHRYYKAIRKKIGSKMGEAVGREFSYLPADTRIPDHTMWHHATTTGALTGAFSHGSPSLLEAKITPIHSLIINAGREEDLWAGSHLLSYLVFNTLKGLVETYGPDVVVYPFLRDLPLFKFSFSNLLGIEDEVANLKDESLIASNCPSRFMAIIPSEKSKEIQKKIQERLSNTWKTITEAVKARVAEGASLDDHFHKMWEEQTNDYFKLRIASLGLPSSQEELDSWWKSVKKNLPKNTKEKYEDWLTALKKGEYSVKPTCLYGLGFELLAKMIAYDSQKFHQFENRPGRKCSICGKRNALSTKQKTSKELWKDLYEHFGSAKVNRNERLCAICTVKRFYREWLREEFRKKKEDFTVDTPSLSEITLRKKNYLSQVKGHPLFEEVRDTFEEMKDRLSESTGQDLVWDPEWLYLRSYDRSYLEGKLTSQSIRELEKAGLIDQMKEELKKIHDELGGPPKYYGVLAMDGDKVAKKLAGDSLNQLRRYMHPKTREFLQQREGFEGILKEKRRLSPSVHMAMSHALGTFTVSKVPKIVKEHRGVLIYAGGEDILALLPPDTIFDAAREIRETFERDFDAKGDMLLGNGSTMSAGIALAHYKHPLKNTITTARENLKAAKEGDEALQLKGRDSFVVSFLKRSGKEYKSRGKWHFLHQDVMDLIERIVTGEVSPRFIYECLELRERLDTSSEPLINEEALNSLLRYKLDRHSSLDPETLDKTSERLISLLKEPKIDKFREFAVLLKILFDAKGG